VRYRKTSLLLLLTLLLKAPPCRASDRPFWVKCAAGLAHLVGRGDQLEEHQLRLLNEKLTEEGRSADRVREAFDQVVQPKITPFDARGLAYHIRVGRGDSAKVTYAYGQYPGADPPLIKRVFREGKTTYTATEGSALVNEAVAHATQWPLVVRDRRLISSHPILSDYLKTKDTMIALGRSGQGPEVVSWGIRRESATDPKSPYILRVVTKNLRYGENVIAAGTLKELSYTLSRLSPEEQKLAARLLTEQACYHPDPHLDNSYLVIRRGAQGELELKPYYVDMDGGLGLLRPTLVNSSAKTVDGRADIFSRLQARVLHYFSDDLSKGQLLFRATELLGDTPDNRAIDKILFPESPLLR
jgi:hypothetical protein